MCYNGKVKLDLLGFFLLLDTENAAYGGPGKCITQSHYGRVNFPVARYHGAGINGWCLVNPRAMWTSDIGQLPVL